MFDEIPHDFGDPMERESDSLWYDISKYIINKRRQPFETLKRFIKDGVNFKFQ